MNENTQADFSDTVYIAGPMTGYQLYNFPAFDAAARRLRAAGFCAINPAELDRAAGFDPTKLSVSHDWSKHPPGLDFRELVRRDLNAIARCGRYLLLDGWERSKGARAEKGVLDWQGAIRLYPQNFHPWKEPPPFLLPRLAYPAPEGIFDAPKPETSDATNPKDLLGLKKPPLRLVPAALTILVSRVMGLGAKKYGAYNWREKKVRKTIYLEAAMRHILQALDGSDKDSESGLPHEAHAAACMGILLDAQATGNLIDDRPTPGAAEKLIAELTEKS